MYPDCMRFIFWYDYQFCIGLEIVYLQMQDDCGAPWAIRLGDGSEYGGQSLM